MAWRIPHAAGAASANLVTGESLAMAGSDAVQQPAPGMRIRGYAGTL